ncbi:MAG: DUF2335 domain-containing protein [Chthoniobacteraceae bacterium]
MSSPEEKQLEKLVRETKPGLLKNLPGEKKQQILELLQALSPPIGESVVVQQSRLTTSPVPPAELLQGYSAAFENGAERLFKLVEQQSDHRHKIEAKVVDSQIEQSRRGQILAFILALLFGALGLYFGIIGQVWLAGTVLTTTVGGLVTTFLVGRKNQDRNLDKKAPK